MLSSIKCVHLLLLLQPAVRAPDREEVQWIDACIFQRRAQENDARHILDTRKVSSVCRERVLSAVCQRSASHTCVLKSETHAHTGPGQATGA